MSDAKDIDGARVPPERLTSLELRIARLEAALARLTNTAPDDAQWSASGFPILASDVAITAETPQHFSRFLAAGWWEPEPWGAWGRDQQHAIRFHIPGYQGGYVDVALVLQAFMMPDGDPLEVHITANGLFLGRHSLRAEPRAIRLRLTPAAIGDGDVILYLQSTELRSPASLDDTYDPRLLGAGLVSISLC